MVKFDIEQGAYGKKMVLKSEWSSQATDYFLENDIKELDLNIAFGWRGDDFSFLKDLKGLLALDILAGIRNDVSPIHYLSELRILNLSVVHKSKIDFSYFPHLEEVYLDWSPKVKSVFNCISLKKILMCKYKSKDRDLSPFSNLLNLEFLCLKVANITKIGDIPNLKKLTILEIGLATKLTSLVGIESLNRLKRLEIDTCRKISNIDPIMKLSNLEQLFLANCGNIESLKPISNLKKLRVFHFYESTNILDGDILPLKSLPNLEKVSFRERRHYNLKCKDLPGYKPIDPEILKQLKSGNLPDFLESQTDG